MIKRIYACLKKSFLFRSLAVNTLGMLRLLFVLSYHIFNLMGELGVTFSTERGGGGEPKSNPRGVQWVCPRSYSKGSQGAGHHSSPRGGF